MKLKRSDLKKVIKEVLGERAVNEASSEPIYKQFEAAGYDIYMLLSTIDGEGAEHGAKMGKLLGKHISEHSTGWEEADAFRKALKAALR